MTLMSVGKIKAFFPLPPFVSHLLHLASVVVLVFFIVLFSFTVLARLNIASIFGGAVVSTGSMEPSIRRGDMVVWVSGSYGRGDPVLYCLTQSFCIVHRYIADCPSNNCILTKGDANPAPDPFPVSRSMVKGVVVLVVPREVWIPLLAIPVFSEVLKLVKTRFVGVSAGILLVTTLVFVIIVHGFTQLPILGNGFNPPVLYLSRAEFNASTCTIHISYTSNGNGLVIAGAEARVDSLEVLVDVAPMELVLHPPMDAVAKAYSSGEELLVEVKAHLKGLTGPPLGDLTGVYKVRIIGEQLVFKAVNGVLAIYNPNCFPVELNITFKYAYSIGDEWRYTDTAVVTVGGFEEKVVQAPEGAGFVYAITSYVVGGVRSEQLVVVRYG